MNANATPDSLTNLVAGLDFRLPQYRQETFLRFYDFHLRYRAHPGCVYYLFPHFRDAYGWTDDEALWFAFLNGNTQNPLVSLMLWRRFPTVGHTEEMLEWFGRHYALLPFDTDRRHHKKNFPLAARWYAEHVGPNQTTYWHSAAERGWSGVWQAATAIPSFGRLSAFSYSEYVRIMLGPIFDCDDLLLDDQSGSRSHRNGLCIALGLDHLDWHSSNPSFDGKYDTRTIGLLQDHADDLLAKARFRAMPSYADDVSYLTMESALCTYKSWHRKNRRYPNVYNDMLYDRLRKIETLWPDEPMRIVWEARERYLPAHLRLETSPHDPGCVPEKQNYYRETGCPPMMHKDWPCFTNPLNTAIDTGQHPLRRDK